MPFSINCPTCKQTIKVPEAALGKQVTCPACRNPMMLPSAPPAPRPAPPPPPQPAPVVPVVAVRPRPQADPLDFGAEPPRPPVRARRDDEYYNEPRPRPYRPFDGPSGTVKGLGTTSLVLGIIAAILAFLLFCFAAPFVAPIGGLGLVLGATTAVIAFIQKKGGYGMPIAGAILSFFAMVISLGPWFLLFVGLRSVQVAPGDPYVEAGKGSVSLGEVRVEVKEVAREATPAGGEGLAILLRVENTGDKQIPYTGWSVKGATLTDRAGQSLALRPMPVLGNVNVGKLGPRQVVTDVLHFAAPADDVEELRLSLPGQNVAFDKDARFRIPKGMIPKRQTGPVVVGPAKPPDRKPPDKKPPDKVPTPAGEPEVRRQLASVAGTRNWLRGVAVAQTGKHLLGVDETAGGRDGSLYLFDLEKRSLFKVIENANGPISVAISPNGVSIITGNRSGSEVQSWNVARGEKLGKAIKHDGAAVEALLFSPDSTKLAAASGGHFKGSIRVVSSANGALLADLQIGNPVHALAWSGDGARLLTGSSDGLARLWDVGASKQEKAYEGHKGPVTHVALPTADERALTASLWPAHRDNKGDGTLRVWDRASGTLVKSVNVREDGKEPTCADFSADGKQALVGYRDGEVVLYDLETGRKLVRYQKHNGQVGHVRFVPGKRLAVSSGADLTDMLVRLWELP